MKINFFTESIDEAIAKGILPEKGIFCDIDGNVGSLKSISSELQALLSDALREKWYGINPLKLTKVVADHVPSSKTKNIFEKNFEFGLNKGWFTKELSKEAQRESIREAANLNPPTSNE